MNQRPTADDADQAPQGVSLFVVLLCGVACLGVGLLAGVWVSYRPASSKPLDAETEKIEGIPATDRLEAARLEIERLNADLAKYKPDPRARILKNVKIPELRTAIFNQFGFTFETQELPGVNRVSVSSHPRTRCKLNSDHTRARQNKFSFAGLPLTTANRFAKC